MQDLENNIKSMKSQLLAFEALLKIREENELKDAEKEEEISASLRNLKREIEW